MDGLLYLPSVLILLGLVIGAYRAFRADNPVLGTNALASAGAVAAPLAIEVSTEPVTGIAVVIGPILPLWIAVAGAMHSIGMATIYERVWWWDHVTHTVSSTLIGAVVYGALLAIDADPSTADLSWPAIIGLTLLVTLLAGVTWELLELVGRTVATRMDREPMLVPYGRLDTAFDLAFDLLGPVLVILLDLRVFVSFAGQSPPAAQTALLWGVAGLIVLTVVLGLTHLGSVHESG